ncbi:AAA family ATPase [Patescibacteria group bacterium]|nr:AAA family ATPase [Patescibacteria group bacterium]
MIIGITGTNGAGKGTIVDYLTKQKGFAHFSVRAFLIEEIKRQGLEIDRTTMRQVANEMRKEHGPSYVVAQLMKQAKESSENAVVESIRAIGEGEFLKQHGALIWAVDADREIRYNRILNRWSETDKIDFETFCMHEDREANGTEAWDMNVQGVMKMADHIFHNETTQEEMFLDVEEALKEAGI